MFSLEGRQGAAIGASILVAVATSSVMSSYSLLMATTTTVFVLLIALFSLKIRAFLRDGRGLLPVNAFVLLALCPRGTEGSHWRSQEP